MMPKKNQEDPKLYGIKRICNYCQTRWFLYKTQMNNHVINCEQHYTSMFTKCPEARGTLATLSEIIELRDENESVIAENANINRELEGLRTLLANVNITPRHKIQKTLRDFAQIMTNLSNELGELPDVTERN